MPIQETEHIELYPGDRCCRIFTEANYQGDFKDFCLGDGQNLLEFYMPDYDFDDVMSSWICGASLAYEFCWGHPVMACNNGWGWWGAGSSRDPLFADYENEMTTLNISSFD